MFYLDIDKGSKTPHKAREHFWTLNNHIKKLNDFQKGPAINQ